jgi:hypothetical protein
MSTTIEQCFLASEAVAWLMAAKAVKTSAEAVKLCSAMLRQNMIARALPGPIAAITPPVIAGAPPQEFRNGKTLYRFVGALALPSPDVPLSDAEHKRLGTLSHPDLRRLVGDMLADGSLSIHTHPEHGECFAGAELVRWLQWRALVDSARDAILVGRLMMREAIVQSVTKHCGTGPFCLFLNAKVLYKFKGNRSEYIQQTTSAQPPSPLAGSQTARTLAAANGIGTTGAAGNNNAVSPINTNGIIDGDTRTGAGSPTTTATPADVEWEFVQSFGDDNASYSYVSK